jgi:signal transduction histidine kinase
MAPSTGRTVYRVVQEALTNVHKHARGAATKVVIIGTGSMVRVSVTNERPVSAGSLLPGSGAGLIGLRERIALQGGSLTARPTVSGGWQVDAQLPAGPAAASGAANDEKRTAGQDAAWLAS